jgi:hypothetical protein
MLARHDVAGYVTAMRDVNKAWDIDDYELVVDPAAAQGNLVDGKSVLQALIERGEDPIKADNSVEAGVFEVRERMRLGSLHISQALTGLQDKAVEYAAEDREDGVFKPKKNRREHRLDALRYGLMHRRWLPEEHDEVIEGADVALPPPKREPLASVMGWGV